MGAHGDQAIGQGRSGDGTRAAGRRGEGGLDDGARAARQRGDGGDRLKVVVCLSPTNLIFILQKTKTGWK